MLLFAHLVFPLCLYAGDMLLLLFAHLVFRQPLLCGRHGGAVDTRHCLRLSHHRFWLQLFFSWFFSLSYFSFFESDFNFFMLFLNVAVQIENNQTIQVCAQTRAALRDLESCCWLSGSKQRRGLQGLSSGRSRGRRCRGATGGGEELGQQEVTGAKWHHPDHPDISPYTQLGRSKGGKKGVDVWHHFREKPLPPPQWHHNNGPISGW